MPRPKKTVEPSSSPDPLAFLPPPRFSPLKRNSASPHKQLQLRLLEVNADIGDDRTIESVLQELTPGRKNSFSFIDGRVNGREVFVTTRKPAGKRGRPRKQLDDETTETPKRGRPRTRGGSATPSGTPRTPKKSPKKSSSPRKIQEIEVEDVEIVDVDATETSQAEGGDNQGYSEEESGFQETEYDPQTPTPTNRLDSPLPIEPYRSFHSSPPSSPIYEEYQVPIPTSSSPVKPSSPGIPSPQSDLDTLRYPPIQTPMEQMKRRRARSRSASRERRLSIAPLPSWQGLPATPRRTVSEESESMDSRQSLNTRSTIHDALDNIPTMPPQYNEGMTPVRNWAAEVAEGAFKFDKSPSKIIQLPITSHITTSHAVTVEDDMDDYDDGFIQISDDEPNSPPPEPLPKFNPQIARLRESREESPIVITSSPPEQPKQVFYQWKTVVDPTEHLSVSQMKLSSRQSTPQQSAEQSQEISSPPQQRHYQWKTIVDPEVLPTSYMQSRQSSPARSIMTELGDDVVDISSTSPLAAKRAADILLQTKYYEKFTFDDEKGRKIWEKATKAAGEYELSKVDIPSDSDESQDNMEEEDMEQDCEKPISWSIAPPKISDGPWSKLDWKRMEKCLDLVDGDLYDAIDLFQERYMGREREEIEMRCRAVLLTRRRRLLEGRRVGFLLGTGE